MKSLDRNSLEEQTRLVSRYVAGDLSRSERAEFEAWLIASPELAAEVEMERRLRRGMASAARRGWLNRPLPKQQAAPSRRWQMALAASVLLSMGLAVMLTLPGRDDTGDATRVASSPSPKRVASPLSVRLSRLRGAGDAAHVQFSLAEMAMKVEAARLLVYNAARLKERGRPYVKQAAMAKLYSSLIAEQVASEAVEIFGGLGFTKESPVEKLYRDAKIGRIYEGTSNMQRMTIAKEILS